MVDRSSPVLSSAAVIDKVNEARAVIRNLFNRLRGLNGIPGTIARGNQSCPCTLRQGANPNQAEANDSFVVQANEQEIYIAANQYQPTGIVSLPQIDDRITFTPITPAGAQPMTLRVTAPDNSSQCYGFCDLENTELVIHTKRI